MFDLIKMAIGCRQGERYKESNLKLFLENEKAKVKCSLYLEKKISHVEQAAGGVDARG